MPFQTPLDKVWGNDCNTREYRVPPTTDEFPSLCDHLTGGVFHIFSHAVKQFSLAIMITHDFVEQFPEFRAVFSVQISTIAIIGKVVWI
jgi:hypothetical protein